MMTQPSVRSTILVCGLLAVVVMCPALGQEQPVKAKDPAWLLPAPEIDADPKIPTLAQVVGHRWGQEVSSHAEIERYCHALAKAAPERCQLVKYGQSYEGKDLNYLILAAPDHLKNIDTIRTQNLALADPRTAAAKQAEDIAAAAPVIVWLAYCVHGNEASPSDAALVTAYHLLADRRPQTRALLDKLVVIIDPLQNPDGRDRFVSHHRESRGGFDQDSPLASERLERWPGGRFNHYLFDLNRDWYLHTQKETAARVAAFLRWKPQIFVDAHEMGADSTFFFDPSAEPYNALTLRRQRDWHTKIGRVHAEHFDRHGFAYTNREMFDAFGPQYGSTWPTLHGSIGILWEQAGVRGRVVTRDDQSKLFYHDGVRHHYVSGLATLEAAAKDRRQLLLDFHQNAADSIKLGETGAVKGYFLLEGKRPARAAALAHMLVRNGIEVRRTTSATKAPAIHTATERSWEEAIPAGSYYIALNQPAARLALTLLERQQSMPPEYIKKQEDRVRRGLPDEIYDVTAWSLPLAYEVPCLATSAAVQMTTEPMTGNGLIPGRVVGKRPKIGYLLAGDDDSVLPALAQWLTQGLRVHVLSEPTKIDGVAFGRGSFLLRVADNPESLHDAVAGAAKTYGLTVHAVDTAFVDEGAGLGGPNVHWVRPPRVLLTVDRPASHSVGHTWYLFDQVWHYPTTRVAARNLPRVDWTKFDVCILPAGKYTGAEGPSEDVIRRLKDWVHSGGTLIVVGGAAEWAAGEKVGLLTTKLERRKTKDVKNGSPAGDGKIAPEDVEKRSPLRVPGAFLRATVDEEHFVTWGVDKEPVIHFHSDRLFTPLKDTVGKNLVTFSDKNVLVSGYCWPETLEQVPGKPFVLHQSLGRGHVIAFADDPNYRAYSPPLQRLFYNSVFLSKPTKRSASNSE